MDVLDNALHETAVPGDMKTPIKIVLAIGLLLVLVAIAIETGLARQAFFELFARIKGVEVLSPTIVRVPPKNSPYQLWLETAKTDIPVFEALAINDINSIALEPWPQMGTDVTGSYLSFADYQMSDGRLFEIPGSGKTIEQRHLYEMGIYFMDGPGHTIIQQEGEESLRIDWNEGSLFSVPLNVRYQHFNDSNRPVRLLAITSFPFVLNAVDNEDFVNNNTFEFTDRFGHGEHFLDHSARSDHGMMKTNFVDDILHAQTFETMLRGKGSSGQKWDMAGNSMLSLHISEMPPNMYKKAHRHSNDAFILVLSGNGYSLTWPEGNFDKRKRIDWQPGTLFVPPTYWYHQHLNTGSAPARYLAINVPDLLLNLGLRFSDQLDVDLAEIRQKWEQEQKKKQQQ